MLALAKGNSTNAALFIRPVKKSPLGARLRVILGDDVAMGPDKPDLLDYIIETGSIASAGRRMSMSYLRAWLLIDEMNRIFKSPIVITAKGSGGALLTDVCREVLARYRSMQTVNSKAIAADSKP
jgi:molybdate transport system regulatory protein